MTEYRFLHDAYARDNEDVAAVTGEDPALLRAHFDRYGKAENRGLTSWNYLNLEACIMSAEGDLLLVGWADRRVHPELKIRIELGYLSVDVVPSAVAWFHRTDVDPATRDENAESGFVAMLTLPDMPLHSNLTIWINRHLALHTDSQHWSSPLRFLSEALGTVALLADQPVGRTLAQAQALMPAFDDLWQRYLMTLRFALAFENRPRPSCAQSIVITLYRRADMLLPQLAELAPFLATADAEVVLVGNDLRDADRLVESLRGFCQLHDISVRMYLCSGNSGFSVGNNFGADVARGRSLIFMNPDIFPPEDPAAARAAFDFLAGDPGPGLTGGLLYYGDGTLMHSGMYVVREPALDIRRGHVAPVLRVEHFGKGLAHRIDQDAAALDRALSGIDENALIVTAALWRIDKAVFEGLGGLPPEYLFAYYEDADFALRARMAGLPVTVDRSARWVHLEGVGKPKSPMQRAFLWLNRARFSARFADCPLVVDADRDGVLL